jgi:polysaccharide export outer membrane protein
MRLPIVFTALFIITFSCVGQEVSPDKPPSGWMQDAIPTLSHRYPLYRLHINDLLELNVDLAPEFNQAIRVAPDGYISLRGIPPVHVEGQTVPQAVETIKQAYATILHDPVLSVVLKEYERPFFIATGEVQRPGKYDLSSLITATQGVALAGGFNADAKHSKVVVFRQVENGWTQLATLDIKRMLNNRDLAEDVRLQPGDLIYVPKNTLAKVRRFIPNLSTGVQYNPLR